MAVEIRALLNLQIRPDYFARLTPYAGNDNVAIDQRELAYSDVSVFQLWSDDDPSPVGRRYDTSMLVEAVSVENEVEVGFALRLQSI
ncbi:MAG: hypothetical protein ACOYNY_05130 [Caldilineaceae bacterium]